MDDETILITHELIDSYKSLAGGWTRKQLEAFGVYDWPPKPGWKKKLVYAQKRIKKSDLPPLQQNIFSDPANS